MRQLLRRLGKMVLGYGAISWAGPFFSLIFTPIITRFLSPGDYGVADYALTIGLSVSTVIGFAQPQALTAHFNDHPDLAWKRGVLGGALAIAWIIGVPVGIVLFLSAPAISLWAFHDEAHQILFQLIGLTTLFGVSSGILTTAAQAYLRVRWGMLFSSTIILATVLGNIVFIVFLRLGATGMVLTTVLSGTLTCAVAWVTMRKTISIPSRAILNLLVRSGAVLLPTMLAYWVLLVADRLVLIQFVSTEELGHYAIANRIAALMTVALTPISTAWTPLALSIQNEADAKSRYASVARYLIVAALGISLFLGLFATEILTVLTRPSYLPAAPYVGFLTYIHVFSVVATVLTTGALVSKQLGAISITVVAGAVVNMILNISLIPAFGLWGATFATVAGFAVPQVLLYLFLNRRYPIPYPLAKLIGIFAIHFSLLVLGAMLPPLDLAARLALKAGLFLALPCAFVILGIISTFELKQARQLVERLISDRSERWSRRRRR